MTCAHTAAVQVHNGAGEPVRLICPCGREWRALPVEWDVQATTAANPEMKVRARMLREAAAELTNLAEAYHANGGPLLFPQPCCQTAVRVAAAYLDSWAKKPGPFPSWKEREEGDPNA